MINLKKEKKIGIISWFKTNSFVNYIYISNSLDELFFFLSKKPQHLFINILGACSNTFFRDGGTFGVIIRLGSGFSYIKKNSLYIQIGCSIMSSKLCLYSTNNCIYGLYFLKGIPGTIGGLLSMNAGCYGNDILNVIHSVKALHCHTFQVKSFFIQELLSYRSKKISSNWIFFETVFITRSGIKHHIYNQVIFVNKLRLFNQPKNIKNSGSTFKNIFYLKVWKILKQSKILRFIIGGGAMFSIVQPNFLVNRSRCSSLDIENLVLLVKYITEKKFAIKINRELKILGNYKHGI